MEATLGIVLLLLDVLAVLTVAAGAAAYLVSDRDAFGRVGSVDMAGVLKPAIKGFGVYLAARLVWAALVTAVGFGSAANLVLQFLDSFAFIVLAAAGLAIIFGIMGVINLAHGEFILVGAYATTLAATQLGLPLVAAMAVGTLVTAAFGLVVERTIVSGAVPNAVGQRAAGRDVMEPLYDRLADSMVATFGLSLIMTQGARIAFGNSIDQIGTPFGEISYGAFSYSTYRIVLAGVSVAVLLVVYYAFTRTDYGMRARATIQDEQTARALGVNTERTYMATFAIGSGLAGLTGALFAPIISMQPTLGDQFLVEAFVAVVVGGPSVVLGTALSGGVLGAINAAFSNLYGTFVGRIMLLIAAMLALRFLPEGITGFIERVRARREGS